MLNILSDPPFKDSIAQFTTVLLNAFVWRSIDYIFFQMWVLY